MVKGLPHLLDCTGAASVAAQSSLEVFLVPPVLGDFA